MSTLLAGADVVPIGLVDDQHGFQFSRIADLAEQHALLQKSAEIFLFQRRAGPGGQLAVGIVVAGGQGRRQNRAGNGASSASASDRRLFSGVAPRPP